MARRGMGGERGGAAEGVLQMEVGIQSNSARRWHDGDGQLSEPLKKIGQVFCQNRSTPLGALGLFTRGVWIRGVLVQPIPTASQTQSHRVKGSRDPAGNPVQGGPPS